ncbi:hypothetical protein EOM86_06620 [Candidatus Nomurabacteria bacterium]|nr:hypothetical protein [Candidatus Nomurabacteria bacterium]
MISSTFSTISSGKENSVELSAPGSTDGMSVSDISEDPESISLSEEPNTSSDAISAPSETSDAESSYTSGPKDETSAGIIAGIVAASVAAIAGIYYGVKRQIMKKK